MDEGAEKRVTAAEGWLGAELFQHKLLYRIIEHAPPHSDTRLARPAEELSEETLGPIWAPREANPRREGFVICLGQTVRNSLPIRHLVSRKHNPQGKQGIGPAGWIAICGA